MCGAAHSCVYYAYVVRGCSIYTLTHIQEAVSEPRIMLFYLVKYYYHLLDKGHDSSLFIEISVIIKMDFYQFLSVHY